MKYEIKIKNYKSKKIQLIIGSITGLTTGVTSIYTMPFIFLIQSLNYSKNKVIQLMGLSFFIFASMQLVLFSSYQMINFNNIDELYDKLETNTKQLKEILNVGS